MILLMMRLSNSWDTGEGVGPSSNHEAYSRISALVYADGHAMAYFLGEYECRSTCGVSGKAVLTVDGGNRLRTCIEFASAACIHPARGAVNAKG